MKRNISLYIADQPVDLNDTSFVLFNYTQEEYSNPTIVKNSFTQQITLEGTPANNKLFGDIFRSDRVVANGTSTFGAYFDPARKTTFVIYDETNEILESGYVKLDKITRKGNTRQYYITLYGGLGAFFYALSYDDDGNKRTLADLKFTGENAKEDELDFVITKRAVLNAWRRLDGARTSEIWDILNFAPCYNGLPGGSFDADKAIVNASNAGLSVPSGYTTQSGFVLASLANKHTDLETHDLRSYLQRPVIRFSAIMDAICAPYNNGGYSVELDDEFFDGGVPYYDNAFITLPIINTLDAQVKGFEGIIIPKENDNINIPNGGNTSINYNVKLSVFPSVRVSGVINSNLYMYTSDEHTEGEQTIEEHYLNYITYTAKSYDSNGNLLQTQTKRVSSYKPDSSIVDIDAEGYFDRMGNWNGESADFEFSGLGISYIYITRTITAVSWGTPTHPNDTSIVWTGTHSYNNNKSVVSYGLDYNPDENTYKYTTNDSARSGVNVTKSMLLSSDKTPADYLLSYCKMFGLVFHYDKAEKKVYILQKGNFYQNEIVDLSGRINTGEEIEISPFAFSSKWYDFGFDYEGEFADYYNNIYNKTYGLQRVNTGYEFDANTNDLLSDSAFVGSCEVLEKSPYYCDIVNGTNKIPSVFMESGCSYSLKDSSGNDEDFDITPPPATATKTWWNSQHNGCDFDSRLQLHKSDNGTIETRDSLVFYTGLKDVTGITNRLCLTDDTGIMMLLNNNVPCWLLDYQLIDSTYKVTKLPVFSRYIKDYTGKVAFSLDMGTPAEINVPDLDIDADSSVYSLCWKKYISDRYDDNTKVLSCKVNLSGMQVNETMFRKFYYFENGVWVLNKISNHSLTTYDDTTCEFVKVNDIDNYLYKL